MNCSENEEMEPKIDKRTSTVTHVTMADEAPFSSTDTDNTSTTPSLGTERSTLKDNVYATLGNTLLDDRQPAGEYSNITNPTQMAANGKSTAPSSAGTMDGYDNVNIGAPASH